jgi:hypothetical protein
MIESTRPAMKDTRTHGLQARVSALQADNEKLQERICGAASIIGLLYRILEVNFEAPPDLLSVIGSYGDTLDDSEVLQLLKDYNATGKVMHERQ